jgi:hypothetical protein
VGAAQDQRRQWQHFLRFRRSDIERRCSTCARIGKSDPFPPTGSSGVVTHPLLPQSEGCVLAKSQPQRLRPSLLLAMRDRVVRTASDLTEAQRAIAEALSR